MSGLLRVNPRRNARLRAWSRAPPWLGSYSACSSRALFADRPESQGPRKDDEDEHGEGQEGKDEGGDAEDEKGDGGVPAGPGKGILEDLGG